MNKTSILVALGLLAGSAVAQDAPAPPPDRNGKTESPFKLDDVLEKLLGAKRPESPEEFHRLEERPALPAMSLRGLVRMKGRKTYAALVEIEGVGRYTVRDGDRLAFTVTARRPAGPVAAPTKPTPAAGAAPGDPRVVVENPPAPRVSRLESVPLVMKILHVGRDGVVVELGTVGEVLIIR
ncbi:MAG: hypothetical protein R3F20_03705 [Planctomycetota bacterium]